MTSVFRTKAQNLGLVSKYANISTPCYNDAVLDNNIPIPFNVQNGIININITNASVQSFINDGFSPNDDSEYQAKSMGGYRLATRIGANFETYLRNYINRRDSVTYTGPLNVFVPATMAKVQIAQPNNVNALQFENVFGVCAGF